MDLQITIMLWTGEQTGDKAFPEAEDVATVASQYLCWSRRVHLTNLRKLCILVVRSRSAGVGDQITTMQKLRESWRIVENRAA